MKIQESNNVAAVPDTDKKLSKAEIKTTNHEKDNNVQVLNGNKTHSDNQETRDENVKNLLKNKNEIGAVEAATTNVDNRTEDYENSFAEILSNSVENLDQTGNGAAQDNNDDESARTNVASEHGVVIQGEAVTYSRNHNVRAPFSGAAIAAGAPGAPPSSDVPVMDPNEFVVCGRGMCYVVTGIVIFGWAFISITTKGGFSGLFLPKHWSNQSDNGDFYGENSTAIGMANITEFGMNNITDIGMGNITEIMANSTTSAASSLVVDYTIWIILGIMYAILHLVDCFWEPYFLYARRVLSDV